MFCKFYVYIEVLQIHKSLKVVEHVVDVLECLVLIDGMRTWRLNAIDDAHKRIDQAHTEVVEVLLLLAGETLVNRLQTHLTSRDKNSHSLFKVCS